MPGIVFDAHQCVGLIYLVPNGYQFLGFDALVAARSRKRRPESIVSNVGRGSIRPTRHRNGHLVFQR